MITNTSKKWLFALSFMVGCSSMGMAQQTVQLSGKSQGKRFDGIGVVNGGGATAVLLKDYPFPVTAILPKALCPAIVISVAISISIAVTHGGSCRKSKDAIRNCQSMRPLGVLRHG